MCRVKHTRVYKTQWLCRVKGTGVALSTLAGHTLQGGGERARFSAVDVLLAIRDKGNAPYMLRLWRRRRVVDIRYGAPKWVATWRG